MTVEGGQEWINDQRVVFCFRHCPFWSWFCLTQARRRNPLWFGLTCDLRLDITESVSRYYLSTMMRAMMHHVVILQALVAVVSCCVTTTTAFLDAIVSKHKNNECRPWSFSFSRQQQCYRRPTGLILFSDSSTTSTSSSKNNNAKKLSVSDKDRLLLTEPALNAFIVAEMRDFLSNTLGEFDRGERPSYSKWKMNPEEKLAAGLISIVNDDICSNDEKKSSASSSGETRAIITNQAYAEAIHLLENNTEGGGGALAVDWICNATAVAFHDGFHQGLLSALGSAILFFRNYYREPHLIAACERVGLSDYDVAHHISDMYHHRNFRGTYTKTLAPSGKGEIAARLAVGLPPPLESETQQDNNESPVEGEESTSDLSRKDDVCLMWSPTTPGFCLHWKSEDDQWRQKRFERIQMEGTRDPRRGGSGTTR
jgi:hypothetical protein